jgi:hypothetical protein
MTDTMTAEHEYGTDHQEGPDTALGGTLEHLDPTSLVLELSARKRVTRVHGPVRDMENAFATHRRRS